MFPKGYRGGFGKKRRKGYGQGIYGPDELGHIPIWPIVFGKDLVSNVEAVTTPVPNTGAT